MKDLTFFHDGNRTRDPAGLVRVSKLRTMAARARDLPALGAFPYTFTLDAAAQAYLRHPPAFSLDRLTALSEAAEPRDA
jgi:hypothetical protein